jgi:hypothetical protein
MQKTSTRVRLHLKPTTGKSRKVRLRLMTPRKVPPPREGSKAAKMLVLLTRPTGATLGELVHLTGWREHSVRAALTAIVRERLGLRLTSVKSWDRRRRYYVTTAETQDPKLLPEA